MRIHVSIATTGRPEIVRKVVARLREQTRPADGILVIGAEPRDVAGIAEAEPSAEVIVAQRGLCKQRNAALNSLTGRTDVVVFFDDDFIPRHDYLENVERILRDNPDVVGLTGHLIKDGAQSSQISFEEAVRRIDVVGEKPEKAAIECNSLYGCNMTVRMSAVGALRFDENLPLYGWQEDVDFTYQLGWRGRMLKLPELTGIHLGTRGGRTSGLRLGYSQIANILYLKRKGTIAPWQGEGQLIGNLIANVVRSFWPEEDVDRRGRLKGNVQAMLDWARGTIDPRRIESL